MVGAVDFFFEEKKIKFNLSFLDRLPIFDKTVKTKPS